MQVAGRQSEQRALVHLHIGRLEMPCERRRIVKRRSQLLTCDLFFQTTQ